MNSKHGNIQKRTYAHIIKWKGSIHKRNLKQSLSYNKCSSINELINDFFYIKVTPIHFTVDVHKLFIANAVSWFAMEWKACTRFSFFF